MSEYSVSDYVIFTNAVETANSASEKLSTAQKTISQCKSELDNDAVFMGPICESCVEGFSKIDTNFTEVIGKFTSMSEYLNKVSDNYKNGDKDASSLISSLGSTGSTQASEFYDVGSLANNGDKAAQQDWLDKMASLVTPICEQYGFPVSVMLAQIIQESGWVKSSSWLNQNNNVLNVNYEMFGSGDYVRSKDGTVNENVNIPKWAEYKTWASGTVSGGANFEAPRDNEAMRSYNSIEDCVEDYLGLMVGYRPYLNGSDVDSAIDGVKGYAEDANYASNLHRAVDSYGLTKYDV